MLSDCDNKELSQKFFVTVFKFFLMAQAGFEPATLGL